MVGYPRWLSGDLKTMHPTEVARKYQSRLFPGTLKDKPYEDVETFKRHHLSFPFYPFRTLCPRDLAALKLNGNKFEFDSSSPIIPANTQINCVFTKRNPKKLLNYLLPFNLDTELGTSANQLTTEKRKISLTFTVNAAEGQAARRTYVISDVNIHINDMYLQVKNIFYKSCF